MRYHRVFFIISFSSILIIAAGYFASREFNKAYELGLYGFLVLGAGIALQIARLTLKKPIEGAALTDC